MKVICAGWGRTGTRSLKYALDHSMKSLVMVGGVAANSCLREMMNEEAYKKSIKVHIAPKAYCTDNAAMIGTAALLRLECGTSPSSIELGVSARFQLENADSLYKADPPF